MSAASLAPLPTAVAGRNGLGPFVDGRFDTAPQIEYAVGVRVLIRVLFAIVALQLAFGLQLASAHAVYAASGAHAASDACAAHNTAPKPADKHDCCKLSGNQCQCSSLALAFYVVLATEAPDLPSVLTAIVASPANAPPDSPFRPPISS